MKKVLIVLGPTAVGKSEFAVKLAKTFNGEIISADSVQIYKGLDIGSAKITQDEMQGVVHHCIDLLEPNEEFSVFEYINLTKQKIEEIISRGKLPIIAGGTGLYIRALLDGYDFGGAGKSDLFREKLQQEAESDLNGLYLRLKGINPEMASKIKPTDQKRIIRALEICEFGEKPTQRKSDIDALVVVLTMERQKLYDRINLRAQIMLDQGLIQEVKELQEKGLTVEHQSMKAIGYKEVISYLNGEIDEVRLNEILKQHTRNYAKRQMTFFRSLSQAKEINVEDKEKAFGEIKKLVEEWK